MQPAALPAVLPSAATPPVQAMPLTAASPDATLPAATPLDTIPLVAARFIATPPARCRAATPPTALLSGALAPVMLPAIVALATALAASDLDGVFPAATRPSRSQAISTMTATLLRPMGRGRVWWGGRRVCYAHIILSSKKKYHAPIHSEKKISPFSS